MVCLYRRNFGVYTLVKSFKTRRRVVDGFSVDEDRLIESMPGGWLPGPASRCLLTVAVSRGSSEGQVGLKRFLNWSKYFPSYVVSVIPSRVFKTYGTADRRIYEASMR